jgi:hypothetical protein
MELIYIIGLLMLLVRARADEVYANQGPALTSLSIVGCDLSPSFVASISAYTCTSETDETTGTYTFPTNYSFDFVFLRTTYRSPTDVLPLEYGENELYIIAENSQTGDSRWTKVVITRPEPTPVCDFNLEDDIYEYSCVVTNDITSVTVDSFAATTGTETSAVLVGDGILTEGITNPIEINVTSEDKTITTMYTFSVYRESNVATLDDLMLGSCTWASWSSTRFEYNCTVTPTVASVTLDSFTMTKGGESESSVVATTPTLVNGEVTDVIVTVTADDGVTETIYTIAVYRQCDIATLSDLVFSDGCTFLGGWSVTADQSERVCYVAHDVTQVWVTSFTPSCGSTAVSLTDASSLTKGIDNTVSVVATADDDVSSVTYTILVHRLSDISTLASLKLSLES